MLKDVDITDRRLQNMIMNGSMSKRFRFLDEFFVFDIAIYHDLTYYYY